MGEEEGERKNIKEQEEGKAEGKKNRRKTGNLGEEGEGGNKSKEDREGK